MQCRRAFELDLPGFLANPEAEEFAAFRSHYPECRDCAQEVQAWTDLHLQLQSGADGPDEQHPSPEQLLRLQEEPGSLAPEERQALQQHAAACASCRDELGTLRSFDFDSLRERAPSAAPRVRMPLRLAAVFRRLFWHPAFAYGLVLVLSLPLLFSDSIRPGPGPRTRAESKPGRAPEIALVSKDPSVAGKTVIRLDQPADEIAAAPRAEPVRASGDVPPGVSVEHEIRFADSGATRQIGNELAAGQRKEKQDREAAEEAIRRLLQSAQSNRPEVAAEPPDSASVLVSAGSAPTEAEGRVRVVAQPTEFERYRGVAEDIRVQTGWTVVDLQPGRSVDVLRGDLGAGLHLRLPLDEAAKALGHAEIRIRLRDTAQQLTQRFRFGPEAERLEMHVDASFLAPGVYPVGVHAAGADSPALQMFRFSVR
jgi:hypothetical protein